MGKKKSIERLLAEKIAEFQHQNIAELKTPVADKVKLRDFVEGELLKIGVLSFIFRPERYCQNCYSRNVVGFGADKDRCLNCGSKWEV